MRTALALVISIVAMTPMGAHADRGECRNSLTEATTMGVIHSVDITASGVEVVVDEDAWTDLALRSKERLVATIGCAMLDPGEQSDPIIVRGHRTNDVVGWHVPGRLTIPLYRH